MSKKKSAFPFPPSPKGKKQDSPALAKREEAAKKDLDGDGEKGEPKAHQVKVLGKAGAARGKKASPFPPPLKKKGK